MQYIELGFKLQLVMCDRRSCSDAVTCLPNHLVKVPKGIRWLVYFGEVLSLVRLTGRLIKYS